MPVSRRMRPKFRERNRERKERAKTQKRRYFYNNVVFASMIEVSWAAAFDAMGIRWVYEPRMLMLDNGKAYPPDFYLPDYRLWVETKGIEGGDWQDPALDWKLSQLVEKTDRPVLLLQGSPQRCLLSMGKDTGSAIFMPSPIGVLVSPNIYIARCKTCKKPVFFKTSPHRFTAAACRCGSWPAEIEQVPASELKRIIQGSLNDDQFKVY